MVAAAGVEHVYNWVTGRVLPIGRFNGSVVQWECCQDLPGPSTWWQVGHLLFIKPRGNIPGHVAMVIGATKVATEWSGWTLEAKGGEGVTVVGPAKNFVRGWDRCGKLDELFKVIEWR